MKIEGTPGFIVGISCDLCGTKCQGDFTYYSLDSREVTVAANRSTANPADLPATFSHDVCPGCMGGLSESVRAHYVPTAVGMNCDLCSAKMRGDFTYFYIMVSRVVVSMSEGQVHCSHCGRTKCVCGNQRFVRVAKMSADDKHLQIVACLNDFNNILSAAIARRNES